MQENAQATEQNHGSAHLTSKQAAIEQVSGCRSRSIASGDPGRMSAQDHAALAGRLRRGERAAAQELVDGYYERIYLFMRALGHDRQVSEDLTQEAFLRAWYHIGQLRDGKALNGWLFRIAGNVSRLQRRKCKGKDPACLDEVEPPVSGVDGSQRAGDREQLDHVQQAVARLPWKLKQAIVLHYMEQLTISEAADAAGVRQGTLKSRLNRGLEALRKEVTNE